MPTIEPIHNIGELDINNHNNITAPMVIPTAFNNHDTLLILTTHSPQRMVYATHHEQITCNYMTQHHHYTFNLKLHTSRATHQHLTRLKLDTPHATIIQQIKALRSISKHTQHS
ncbi:hypothetical protein RND81_02G157500 [Saponaria officinalis]|uniref:Uncharacterized protein n=1 Tax=Saponaria officinalis TaxID=3572 RepID=A0AAW1MW94_SAPOF